MKILSLVLVILFTASVSVVYAGSLPDKRGTTVVVKDNGQKSASDRSRGR
ncbi:MAG: hypothetical protein H2057_02445 [Alphaproteobacteria bacterium]|nr:hypothetical protein [Alphaproteobacteria bacterium]